MTGHQGICMDNVMIDLETLATTSNAAIISIGAVLFCPRTGQIGATFYQTVTRQSCIDIGLDIDPGTEEWWQRQGDAAKQALNCPNAVGISMALDRFRQWILDNVPNGHVSLWGNGPSFDCAIFANAFRRARVPYNYRYSLEKCVRTIVWLGRQLLGIDPKKEPMEGVAHNALSDAIHQAKYVAEIYQKLAERCT